ncbi:zinc-ribbon domain-containing protein [Pseudonocardia alni]|uniref:zinc-ribbon domain-containing protein n=1 Tax=Pseudonocardia alni TaxID=33907 RepID=UPI0033C4F31F
MLVIFGLSRKERPLGLVALGCGTCGHAGPQPAVHRRTRFTLFFVPVLPLRSRYEMRCPVCGAGRTLSRDDARRHGARL